MAVKIWGGGGVIELYMRKEVNYTSIIGLQL